MSLSAIGSGCSTVFTCHASFTVNLGASSSLSLASHRVASKAMGYVVVGLDLNVFLPFL